ncbi:uncharacterized protein LOC121235363 [Juglans microcarpa x Juglans regia]|uniref:uncharacterized protein LOC121235363 n=1 Tax=Juglans microcarpa x Juglans regia TaxID=2249226 RepID=UPI001B7ED242|nr:uncharacterized protein LOC121235363 [Juglans microcarpa x Juglans regia]
MRKRKGETSKGNNVGNGWKLIWGLNVPNVVKHFLWKAAHNLLPTKLNLYKKQITESNCCPICERELETIMHAVWSCPAISDVWAENDSPVNKWCSSDAVFVDLWGKLNAFLKEEEVVVAAYIMRKIWMRKNSLLFEKKFDHPRTIISTTTHGLRELKLAQDQLQKTQVQGNANKSVTKREKPEERVVKANWDAVVDAKSNRVGIKVDVKDSNGELLACLITASRMWLKLWV